LFTGIIESRGTVRAVATHCDGLGLEVDVGGLDTAAITVGDSIAVNGACLTVVSLDGNVARFDVSGETLSKCLIGEWRCGDTVNLETALTLGKPLGGHLVSGHVDGIGQLDERVTGADSSWMRFTAPRSIGRFIAVKGSIAVEGISLTSNNVYDDADTTFFELTLVPHTLAMTTLDALKPGCKVHLEIDLIARYLDRMQESDSGSPAENSPQP